jgi:hypothetical protein
MARKSPALLTLKADDGFRKPDDGFQCANDGIRKAICLTLNPSDGIPECQRSLSESQRWLSEPGIWHSEPCAWHSEGHRWHFERHLASVTRAGRVHAAR